MSYDFMMMKPITTINSPEDLNEQTLALQNPQPVVDGLTRLYPATKWERRPNGGWFGSYDGPDGRYEFSVYENPDRIWSIATSHRATTRSEIGKICRELGLIAFDGQTGEIVRGTE